MVAQMSDLAGLRLVPTKRTREKTGVHYVSAYTTDKASTYQLHRGIFSHRSASQFYPTNIEKELKGLVRGEEVLYRCAGRGRGLDGERLPVDDDDDDVDDDDDEIGRNLHIPADGQEGALRLEVRVSLDRMGHVLNDLPIELLDAASLIIATQVFW